MFHLLITALMKALSLTMENTTKNNLLEGVSLGLGFNFGSSPYLKDIYFMQIHIVEWILVWVRVQMLCWI